MRIDLLPPFDTAGALSGAMEGTLTGDPRTHIKGIATHSGEVQKGDLFVALKGTRTDGAAYLQDALTRGAVGVLSTPDLPPFPPPPLMITAKDPIAALCRAAAEKRRKSDAFLVAVGGSVGKTTVKEGIAALLAERGSVCATKGNFNSEIGFPLSLLSFAPSDYFVVELGINHVGEMERMARAAQPDLAVLTNVGTAHIGKFGSFPTLLAEKSKLCVGLREKGRMLAPVELPKHLFPCKKEQIFTWGSHKKADFRLENLSADQMGICADLITPDGVITNLTWQISGRIGADTLLTLCAAAWLCGCNEHQLRRGLARAAARAPRMRVIELGGRLLIDDTYNASPEAVLNAVEAMRYRAAGRPTVAVLGDMLELGEYSEGLHRAVGAGVARQGISMLFTYGDAARYYAEGARSAGMPRSSIFLFGTGEGEALVKSLCRNIPLDATVLFKGSGKMKMGELLAAMGEYYA